MTISEAMRKVTDEYDAEVARAGDDARFAALMTDRVKREYEQIDKELPDYVSQIAGALRAGKPGDPLPYYVYQMARMCFRLGMRVQRKLDQPEEETSAFAGPRHD